MAAEAFAYPPTVSPLAWLSFFMFAALLCGLVSGVCARSRPLQGMLYGLVGAAVGLTSLEPGDVAARLLSAVEAVLEPALAADAVARLMGLWNVVVPLVRLLALGALFVLSVGEEHQGLPFNHSAGLRAAFALGWGRVRGALSGDSKSGAFLLPLFCGLCVLTLRPFVPYGACESASAQFVFGVVESVKDAVAVWLCIIAVPRLLRTLAPVQSDLRVWLWFAKNCLTVSFVLIFPQLAPFRVSNSVVFTALALAFVNLYLTYVFLRHLLLSKSYSKTELALISVLYLSLSLLASHTMATWGTDDPVLGSLLRASSIWLVYGAVFMAGTTLPFHFGLPDGSDQNMERGIAALISIVSIAMPKLVLYVVPEPTVRAFLLRDLVESMLYLRVAGLASLVPNAVMIQLIVSERFYRNASARLGQRTVPLAELPIMLQGVVACIFYIVHSALGESLTGFFMIAALFLALFSAIQALEMAVMQTHSLGANGLCIVQVALAQLLGAMFASQLELEIWKAVTCAAVLSLVYGGVLVYRAGTWLLRIQSGLVLATLLLVEAAIWISGIFFLPAYVLALVTTAFCFAALACLALRSTLPPDAFVTVFCAVLYAMSLLLEHTLGYEGFASPQFASDAWRVLSTAALAVGIGSLATFVRSDALRWAPLAAAQSIFLVPDLVGAAAGWPGRVALLVSALALVHIGRSIGHRHAVLLYVAPLTSLFGVGEPGLAEFAVGGALAMHAAYQLYEESLRQSAARSGLSCAALALAFAAAQLHSPSLAAGALMTAPQIVLAAFQAGNVLWTLALPVLLLVGASANAPGALPMLAAPLLATLVVLSPKRPHTAPTFDAVACLVFLLCGVVHLLLGVTPMARLLGFVLLGCALGRRDAVRAARHSGAAIALGLASGLALAACTLVLHAELWQLLMTRL